MDGLMDEEVKFSFYTTNHKTKWIRRLFFFFFALLLILVLSVPSSSTCPISRLILVLSVPSSSTCPRSRLLTHHFHMFHQVGRSKNSLFVHQVGRSNFILFYISCICILISHFFFQFILKFYKKIIIINS